MDAVELFKLFIEVDEVTKIWFDLFKSFGKLNKFGMLDWDCDTVFLFDNGRLDCNKENNQLKKHFGVDINFLEIPTELNEQTNQGRRSISEKINNMNNNSILFMAYPYHLIGVIKYDDKIYSIGNHDSAYFDDENYSQLDRVTSFKSINNIDIRKGKQIPHRTESCVNYSYFLAHAFIKFLNERKNLPFQEYYIDLISRYSKKGYTFEQAETSLATEIKVGMVNRLINIKEDIQKTIHKKNNDDNVSIDSSDIKLDIKESDKEDNIVLDYYVDLYRTADKEDFLGQLKNLDIKNLEKIKNEIDGKLKIITDDFRLDLLHQIDIEMPNNNAGCFDFFRKMFPKRNNIVNPSNIKL